MTISRFHRVPKVIEKCSFETETTISQSMAHIIVGSNFNFTFLIKKSNGPSNSKHELLVV